MFRTQWISAARTAKRAAEQAGDHRVGAAVDETRYRARRTLAAIAGRREPTPWRLIIGLTVAGVVAGWLAAAATRRMATAVVSEAARGEEPYDEAEVSPSA